MSSFVLDASAVLALLNEETGKDRVELAMGDCLISAVNYCEVLGKLIDAGVPQEEARHTLELLDVQIVDFDEDLAFRAASVVSATRRFGLSLGDRCCLALGTARSATVLTADRSWAKLKINVKVEVIR